MPRLFLFAIGGTGSRVVKSLSMLLASGVQPEKPYEIVPILIDPHKSNEDLKRTIKILNYYQKIHNKVSSDCGFFATKINTLNNITDDQTVKGDYTFDLQEVENTKFKDYIDHVNLNFQTKKFVELLFSGSSINQSGNKVPLLELEMNIGFVGNPNIGSIILHQFIKSKEFELFANSFNSDDRIFIVSSIFGGTGAAGFPTILKAIRDARNNPQLNVAAGFLENANIGAVTVMPYFNIESDPNSPIQRSDFISKTKAALHYYKSNISGNNEINALYYIGDEKISSESIENDPGHRGQKNDAHFVELAAAYGVIDFLNIPNLETINGKAINPIYKEYALKNNDDMINLSSLGSETKETIGKKLGQMVLFRKYVKEELNNVMESQPFSSSGDPTLKKQFFNSDFFRDEFSEFMKLFDDWLVEMKKNGRSFEPFNIDSNSSLMVFRKDYEIKSGGWFNRNEITHTHLTDKLNEFNHNRAFDDQNKKFIKLFFEMTDKILKSKYGFN